MLTGWLAICILLLGQAAAYGQQFVERSFVVPGDTNAIELNADRIVIWKAGEEQIVLLKGNVFIAQGLKRVNATNAVAWVDEARQKSTGVYEIQIYAENKVVVDAGSQREVVNRALVMKATRGAIRIKSYQQKTSFDPTPNDPIYRNALLTRQASLSRSNVANQAASPPTIRPPGPFPLQKTPTSTPQEEPRVNTVDPFARPGWPEPNQSNTTEVRKTSPATTAAYTGRTTPESLPPPPQTPRFDPNVLQTQATETHLPPPARTTATPAVPVQINPGTKGPIATPVPKNLQPPPEEEIPTPPRRQRQGGVGGLSAFDGGPRRVTIRPRFASQPLRLQNFPMPNGETAIVVTSGVILQVNDAQTNKILIDIEADRMVLWTKANSLEMFNNMQGETGSSERQLEFYLAGNVEIRNQSNPFEQQLLRADSVYYNVNRNVAFARNADLEVQQPRLPNPLHLRAEELIQRSPTFFEATSSSVFSSKLPSDPGLELQLTSATIEERQVTRTNIFGFEVLDRETGEPIVEKQRIFRGRNVVVRIEDIPVFYFPYVQGDPEDPLGPLESLRFNYNEIFGFQVYTSWNVYDLIGIDPRPGTRWRLHLDGLTERGPAVGTDFDAAGQDLFGIPNNYQTLIRAYGIHDTGEDVLGGGRGDFIFFTPTVAVPVSHPDARGRFLSRSLIFDLPYGFQVQHQLALISDQNFLEQFYYNEWINGPNQESYLYVKQQNNNWAWTFLTQPRLARPWITQTEWLPRADGYIIGGKLFDMVTYNGKLSAGYAELETSNQPPPPALYSTDVATDTGRFDFWNEFALPFGVGPFKIVPYVVGDVTYYTNDLNGDDEARLYGALGTRGSMPLSRLYPDASSELLNINGIFHKIVLSGNYYQAFSDDPLTDFPQLDRFNDDASDQSMRDIFPRQSAFNPGNAAFLTSSNLFDPQFYALRRLIDTQIDTRDDIDVLRMGLRQRLQTKRGFPGAQHIVDWMTLDVQASLFPHANRDNFGQRFGIIEYDWIWNIGDRTSFVSNGWFETIEDGPRIFNLGVNLNRPDNTNFYLGYRQIDPLESRAFVGSVTYLFSSKYGMTASTLWDFGVDNEFYSLSVTRIGTDLTVSLGVTYNSVLNNFGVQFQIVPNLLPNLSGANAGAVFTGASVARR